MGKRTAPIPVSVTHGPRRIHHFFSRWYGTRLNIPSGTPTKRIRRKR